MRGLPWVLVLAMTEVSCRRPPPPQATSTPAPVLVVQRTPQSLPILFHPSLPRLGQLRDDACDIWDLEERLYRGSVSAETCRAWARESARPVPRALLDATPHAAKGSDDELISGSSAEGTWFVTARRGDRVVHLWDGPSLALVRLLVKPSETSPIAELTVAANKIVAATVGGPPLVWDVTGGDARFAIDFNTEATWVDPKGRYLACVGTTGGRIPPKQVAVVRLADEKIVLDSVEIPQFERVQAVWARDRAVALAVRLNTIPLEPCGDEQIRAELSSPIDPPIPLTSIERGKLSLASIAPNAGAAALAFTEMDACSEQALATRAKRQSTFIYQRAGGVTSSRVQEGLAVAAAWSPSASHVIFALSQGEILVLDLTSPSKAPGARWAGHAPIAISPDGARVASLENGVLTVRTGRRASPVVADSVRALEWSQASLAVGTSSGVMLLDAVSLEQKQRFSLPEVRSLAFDPTSGTLCAVGRTVALVIDPTGSAQPLDVAESTTASWSSGRLVLHEPARVRRFLPVNGHWERLDERDARAGQPVSADGTVQILDEGFRRLSDGEVLHLAVEGASTESGAFDRSMPAGWVLREGDVLTGRLVRAESASFLRPTPDLLRRFSSGDTIPHPRSP